jgi:hypothetical protein
MKFLMPPLPGLETYSSGTATHGFTVGYMTAPASRAFNCCRRLP